MLGWQQQKPQSPAVLLVVAGGQWVSHSRFGPAGCTARWGEGAVCWSWPSRPPSPWPRSSFGLKSNAVPGRSESRSNVLEASGRQCSNGALKIKCALLSAPRRKGWKTPEEVILFMLLPRGKTNPTGALPDLFVQPSLKDLRQEALGALRRYFRPGFNSPDHQGNVRTCTSSSALE